MLALEPAAMLQTGDFLVGMQDDDGALPWFPGGQWDAWNHTEALMGLTVASVVSRETGDDERADRYAAAARRGLDHLVETQRTDGSWPMERRGGVVIHDEADTNQCAYPAVGVWHAALATGDDSLLSRYWPMIERSLDLVLRAQRSGGEIAWALNARGDLGDDALLTGNASILQSLWAACAIGDRLGHDVTAWRDAGSRLADAVRHHPELFADRARYSMDWFYPVLGGALHGADAAAHLAAHWPRFVWPGHGVRCVEDRPWVTGGESAELVMALLCTGRSQDDARARAVFADIQHLRRADDSYWTGYVVDDDAVWPEETTGWTAGAMLLAADALDHLTPAANFFEAMTWPAR